MTEAVKSVKADSYSQGAPNLINEIKYKHI